MTLPSPDELPQTPDSELTPERAAMKGMAKDILSVAQDIVEQMRLDPPKAGNFAWMFFEQDKSDPDYCKPLMATATLQAFAATGIPQFLEAEDRLVVVFDYDTPKDLGLRQRYGNRVPQSLVRLFAERLGFVQPDTKIDSNNSVAQQEKKNTFTFHHPDKPFTLELPVRGALEPGKPDIRSFVVRYTPK